MNILENATILVVDDEPINLLLMEVFLAHLCKQLIVEENGERVVSLACEKQPAIILLDIMMYEQTLDGYEICRHLKANAATVHIPVIFLSSLVNSSDKVKGFEVGGVDYISKPFESEEVLARIKSCLRLHQQLHQKQQLTCADKAKKIQHYQLTEREVQILTLYAGGCQRNEIAGKLFISLETVKFHLKNIFIKLNVKNRTQAIEKTREIGLITSSV